MSSTTREVKPPISPFGSIDCKGCAHSEESDPFKLQSPIQDKSEIDMVHCRIRYGKQMKDSICEDYQPEEES